MKEKKDILFLCQFFYPEYISSAMLPFDTAAHLASCGKTVGALCGYPYEYNIAGSVTKNEVRDGIEITRVKYTQFNKNSKLGRLLNFFSLTLAFIAKIGILKRYREVIVYSNPPLLPLVALIANRLWGTQLSFVCYDIYPEVAQATGTLKKGDIISRFMERLNSSVAKRAKYIIVLCDEMKRFLLKNRDVDGSKIHSIHNWHTQSYGNLLAKEPRKDVIDRIDEVTKGKFVASYLGNMGLCQDVEIILDAAKMLKERDDIIFLFAGHGCKANLIEKAISEYKLDNVCLMGYLFGEEFDHVLDASDCCLVTLEPSVNGTVAPSKIYSYLAAGKPVLAAMDSECDIVRELEQYNAGASVSDARKLVDAVCSIADSVGLLDDMSKNCVRLYQEKHLKEYSMKKYEELFAKNM